MPRPRRLFFADVETPLSLTPYGHAALPDHDMALQQHTEQGMVFRVEADSAQQAAEQVIGLIGKDAVIGALYDAEEVIAGNDPIAWVAGQVDPRLLPPLLQYDLPPALPDDPSSAQDGDGWGPGLGDDPDEDRGWT